MKSRNKKLNQSNKQINFRMSISAKKKNRAEMTEQTEAVSSFNSSRGAATTTKSPAKLITVNDLRD
jgi:hypothetical protein